jgi:hypothetical protein
MTEAQVLKKFASAVIEMATAAKTIHAKASNLEKMQKEASAKPEEKISFDEAKLQKAASAVASLYGDRAAVNAGNLQKIWSANPNSVVDSLLKVASDAVAAKVREPGMVPVKKQASAAKTKVEMPKRANTATDAFDVAFGLHR